ncbi:MAG: MtrB/PioB family decaheme-associated outer membrane protein [Sulfuritalea sp.]|jgi:MtrB/PioB family decaheme-associated outer membrane protein|nr:MtrB/PioB family decaheme-associated outer membrane protein [Sulfuritalea sp.]
MRIRNEKMNISVLGLAVQGALATMCAMPMLAYADAAQDAVAAIRRPTNSVEIGVENVSQKSAKFGEYNGLNKSGTEFIGNFSVRGGDAYDGGNGTLRWGVTGTDLGTTSRELGATVGNQGRWNLNIGYDELRHNITDTYQTPQQGSMGGNAFTLPANFGAFDAATSPGVRTLNATRLGAFHTEEVGTTRKNTSFGAGFNFSRQLSLNFDYNHLDQSGAKLMASAADGRAATTGTWRAEAVSILMNPTNYETDTFNLALNWVGDQGHLTGAYSASIFKDGYDRLSWQNPMLTNASTAAAGVYQTITMSTAPSNKLHQLNLSGGYAFSSATKLSGGLSYGRNTQNDSFLTALPEIFLSPKASLDGLVITKHADLKLTNQSIKDLMLTASLKHNERDNRTSSGIYQYYAINSTIAGVDTARNAPYSNKKTELGLAGEYRLDKRQSIALAYDMEKISRWCNNYAIAGSCLVATGNSEDKLGIKYKLKAGNDVKLSAGYSYARRKVTEDNNAVTALSGLGGVVGVGPMDVNAQNYPGYSSMTFAGRKQDMLKLGINWQANDKLDLAAEGRYAKDKFDPILGVQSSKSSGINLDATYAYSENGSVAAYASWRDSKKDMRIGGTGLGAQNAGVTYAALVAPTNIWSNQLNEDGNDFGITTKHKLMGGKLELTGDLSYSFDKSRYSTQVPYLATCGLATVGTCGDLPDIKATLVALKLTGIYALNKSSKIAIGYRYQQLKSDDYSYNAFQYGYSSLRLMPTNQVSPNYSENVVAVSYMHDFK